MALLLHMLTSTITLTLLAYQATKVKRTFSHCNKLRIYQIMQSGFLMLLEEYKTDICSWMTEHNWELNDSDKILLFINLVYFMMHAIQFSIIKYMNLISDRDF